MKTFFVLLAAAASARAWVILGTSGSDVSGNTTVAKSGEGVLGCTALPATQSFVIGNNATDFQNNHSFYLLFYTDNACKTNTRSVRTFQAGETITSVYQASSAANSFLVLN